MEFSEISSLTQPEIGGLGSLSHASEAASYKHGERSAEDLLVDHEGRDTRGRPRRRHATAPEGIQGSTRTWLPLQPARAPFPRGRRQRNDGDVERGVCQPSTERGTDWLRRDLQWQALQGF